MLFTKMKVCLLVQRDVLIKSWQKNQLECSQQIEEDLAGLREDFLLNDKSKMLVLVSMATDEMICLVSMYPKVWFMDTTAGECIFCLIYQRILFQFQNNSILDKCHYCN